VIRYVAVLRRRAGSSTQEFLDEWMGRHRELAAALPGVRRIEFQPVVTVDGVEPTYDGVGFLDFTDLASLQASLASPEAKRLREHTQTFTDSNATLRLVVQPEAGTRPHVGVLQELR
jgi:uncharacterized protein (TIGR02118 family)